MKNLVPCCSSLVFSNCTSKDELGKLKNEAVVTYFKAEYPVYSEHQMLRKIFGPVNIDNIWRTGNNMEIDILIEGADIVRFIKAQRIK